MSASSPDKANAGTTAKKALEALTAGDAPQARRLAEDGLTHHPDHPALLQALGLAAMQDGDPATAATALKKCLEAQHNQPSLWEIYGGVLEALNKSDAALDAYTKATEIAPNRASGHRLRGMCLTQIKRYEDALAALEKACAMDSKDAEAWHWSGSALFGLGRLEDAEAHFEKAIALRADWPQAFLNRAATRAEQGKHESALEDYQHAINLDPNDASTFRQFAITLWDMKFSAEAERMFLRSAELDPNSAATQANLSAFYEQMNQLDEAETYAKKALALDPDNWQAQKTLAVLMRRNGEISQALEHLQALHSRAESWVDQSSAAFELAHLHDKMDSPDAAYDLYTEGNGLQKSSPAGQRVDPAVYLKQVEHEAQILKTSPPQNTELSQPDTPPDPVFLMGFPRSGTTLLDQVLDSHPDAVVMDERPPLTEVHKRLWMLEEDQGKPFTMLSDDQRRAARGFYFQQAERHVAAAPGKILIDKHPLATAKIRIIKLLFPRARIIFALRHPCDVVLSAFMQPFTVSHAMANFQTLAGAVGTYQAVMSLWRAAEPTLELPVHTIRYEDLVEDFETQVTAALSFIGLSWDERVAAFHEHAQTRDVRTASARQVTQPLYTSALARWQKYEKYLVPHLDTLQPFIDAFGYDSKPTQEKTSNG